MFLEQVKRSADTDCGSQTMRRAYSAMKLGNWESFKEERRKVGKLCEWTFKRLREACEKVAMDGIDRLGIAQEMLRKSTDFLRRIIATSQRNGRSHHVVCLPTLQQFPLGGLTTFGWWYSRDTETVTKERRSIAIGGVQLVETNTNGERPTGYW